MLALACASTSPSNDDARAETPTVSATPAPRAPADPGEPTPTATPPVELPDNFRFISHPEAPADAIPITVTWVLDGDSFEVDTPDGRDEVRLIGVNANEGFECFGGEAKSALIDEIARQDLLMVVADGRDEFGRLLAYVWHDDVLVNLDLTLRGLVLARSAFGHEYETLFDSAETLARTSQTGLWSPSACGAPVEWGVSIAEVLFDPPGPDDEDLNGEYIDIVNESTTTVELSGWTLRDETTRNRFEFADDVAIGPGATIRVRSGCGTATPSELFWCAGGRSIWSNGGDTAFLLDPSGNIVDSFSWESIYTD